MNDFTMSSDPSTVADFDAFADGFLHVRDRSGVKHRLPGLEGFRVMEILRDFGLEVPAVCGGACACGTCHVIVGPAWRDRLPAPREDEKAKLDDLVFATAESRLACQLIWSKAFDGLEIALAPLEDA